MTTLTFPDSELDAQNKANLDAFKQSVIVYLSDLDFDVSQIQSITVFSEGSSIVVQLTYAPSAYAEIMAIVDGEFEMSHNGVVFAGKACKSLLTCLLSHPPRHVLVQSYHSWHACM